MNWPLVLSIGPLLYAIVGVIVGICTQNDQPKMFTVVVFWPLVLLICLWRAWRDLCDWAKGR